MKRYLVFAHEQYDMRGGWDDLFASADNLTFAKATVTALSKSENEYAHIVDLDVGQIVATSVGGADGAFGEWLDLPLKPVVSVPIRVCGACLSAFGMVLDACPHCGGRPL